MISQSLTDALNEQLKHELYSSYLYLSMSAYCDDQHLPGFAHWMRLQADEEREHLDLLVREYRALLKRQGRTRRTVRHGSGAARAAR